MAFLSTGQIPTEEMALLGAVAKFGMGMVHGDGNTRQCMATSVVAYKEAFGFDAPPYTYADFEESDVIVLVGSNLVHRPPDHVGAHQPQPAPARDHRRRSPRAPRRRWPPPSTTRPRPSPTSTLLYGLAHLLIERGAVDHDFVAAHTTGFDDFAAHVAGVHARAGGRATTGLPVEQLERFADTIAAGERVSFWWTMGVNQSHQGVRTAQAIIDLALMTGNIGRPGTGANSITGQCNAMGSRLFSNTTNLLGGRDFTDADHRAEVADDPRHRRRPHPRPAEPGLRPDHRGHPPGHDQGPLGHRHQLGPLVDQPDRGPRAARPARLPRRAGPVRHHRDGAAGRPRAARRRLGREGGHLHQLRAAHRA